MSRTNSVHLNKGMTKSFLVIRGFTDEFNFEMQFSASWIKSPVSFNQGDILEIERKERVVILNNKYCIDSDSLRFLPIVEMKQKKVDFTPKDVISSINEVAGVSGATVEDIKKVLDIHSWRINKIPDRNYIAGFYTHALFGLTYHEPEKRIAESIKAVKYLLQQRFGCNFGYTEYISSEDSGGNKRILIHIKKPR